MEGMVQVAALGLITVLLGVFFKSNKSEISVLMSLGACLLILLWGIGKLEIILNAINKLQSMIQVNTAYVGILIKIIGITYITEISAALCKDSGYGAISEQIELVGKLSILAISMPILLALLDTINNFLKF